MTHNTVPMTEEHVSDMLERFADGFCYQRRSPILHTPEEAGLDYENVSFPRATGCRWKSVIPPGSAGSSSPTTHRLQPVRNTRHAWSRGTSQSASSGDGFEVNFVPDYKILHDAGYHVLAYDLPNHGSAARPTEQ